MVSQSEKAIDHFLRCIVDHFGKYEPSCFRTEGFHALRCLGDDFKRYGNTKILDVRLYQKEHVVFQKEYRKPSRRRDTCNGEVVFRAE